MSSRRTPSTYFYTAAVPTRPLIPPAVKPRTTGAAPPVPLSFASTGPVLCVSLHSPWPAFFRFYYCFLRVVPCPWGSCSQVVPVENNVRWRIRG